MAPAPNGEAALRPERVRPAQVEVGDVVLEGARPELLQAALDVLGEAGVGIATTNEGIRVTKNGTGIAPVEITTQPFPGFPTDLQAQLMALMTRAKGTSHITETIFENRFMHVQELVRLGAHIHLDGEKATIEVWRQGKREELSATLGDASEKAAKVAKADESMGKAKLGLALRQGQGGLLVEQAGGPAAAAGVQPGDVLLAVNGTPVTDVEQVRAIVAKSSKSVALLIERGGNKIFVPVRIG